MAQPLAFFLSWHTYGTWLPGDERGWVEEGKFEIQPPDPARWNAARERMTGPPVTLNLTQRDLVEAVICKHCTVRGWNLHAVNPRSTHIHVVVTADLAPDPVMVQFKAWCSRHLNEQAGGSKRWWSKGGSTKWINDEEYLHNAIRYVLEMQ